MDNTHQNDSTTFDWKRDTWKFVDSYIKSKDHMVLHHLDSYDRFVRRNVPALLSYNSPVRVHFEYSVEHKMHMKTIEFAFSNTRFRPPTMHNSSGCAVPITPMVARHSKLTYCSDLVVDVTITTTECTVRSGDDKLEPRAVSRQSNIPEFILGRVPVMVNSCLCVTRHRPNQDLGECIVDPGGYFIIGGIEKVTVSLERPAENQIMVYANAKQPSVDIKSIPSGKCVRPSPFQLKIVRGPLGNDVVRVFVPQVRQNIPLWTIMMALGGANDEDIHKTLIMGLGPDQVRLQADQLLRSSMEEVQHEFTPEAAIESIACHVSSFGAADDLSVLTGELKKAHENVRKNADALGKQEAEKKRAEVDKRRRVTFAKVLLRREMLPHQGENPFHKRLFIGRMFRELVYAKFTRLPDDDRDSFVNKRINAAGALMTQIFSQCLGRMVRELKTSVKKTFSRGAWRAVDDFHNIVNKDSLYRHLRASILTKSLRTALATGNFGNAGGRNSNPSSGLIGVAQVLNRLSYSGTLSHLRRVFTPIGNTGKLLKPRALHPTQIFAMCPAETPEGHPVGLVKNLALSARVTMYRSNVPTIKVLEINGAIPLGPNQDLQELKRSTPVFVDGAWWGITHDPFALLTNMKTARRRGHIHPHTSIVWLRNARSVATASSLGEVRLSGTGGRIVRPVYILKNNGTEFVANSKHVEYLHNGVFSGIVCPTLSPECNIRTYSSAVEYIDIAESDTLMIAMTSDAIHKSRHGITIQHTHCELHPSLMFGVLAGVIPFCDHNQSPRNTYQCLDKETPVLMADGTKKAIKNVRVGDSVQTFDPVTLRMKTTRVKHQYVRETDKPMFVVTTASGATINATHDHKFMTDHGWVEVRDLDVIRHKLAWLPQCDYNKSILFVNIRSIESTPTTTIADITTEAETHSFIAGDGFCVHNSAMGKQSMGLYATNFNERFGTLGHMLYHPQRPIVQTRIHRVLPTARMPSGQTLVVAIATNGGYNQEDSIIINQSAVERGLMVSTMTKTYRCDERTTEGTSHRERFCIPDASNTVGMKRGGYEKLGDNGLAKVGCEIRNGDVIIGKVTPQKVKGSRCRTVEAYRDTSSVLRNCSGGIVDRTLIRDTTHGGRTAKVRMRCTREASIGDKFSSRHGQKGTIGTMRRQADMPFSESGITPDIIMNPHAIPSRMTVGQLIETFLSKVCTLVGAFGDGTPFAGIGPDTIHRLIEATGCDASDEILHDPTTGLPMKVKIFMGPTFYQKLKHIARDKAHARSTGPMIHFTRQPTEGRARDGGLRLGEMERDCLIGHGMSNFLWESMLRRSDNFSMGICSECGNIAPFNPKDGIVHCHSCKSMYTNNPKDTLDIPDGSCLSQVRRIEAPYASKLLVHELGTMGVRTQICL